MVEHYGAIHRDGNQALAPARSPWPLRVAAATFLLAAMVIVTLAAVSMSPRTSSVTAPAELLHATSNHPDTGGAGGGDPNGEHKEPDANDFASYKEGMDHFLRSINVDPATVDDDTDLDESCGALMAPCIASVGACLKPKITVANGEVSIQASACNCFAQAHEAHLSAPGRSDIDAHCDYTCLHSISGVLNEYLAHAKSQELQCENTFSHLAEDDYSARSDDDTDGPELLDPDDPKLMNVRDVVGEYIREHRDHHCPNFPTFEGVTPFITYADTTMASEGKHIYHAEVVFNDGDNTEVFHTVVAHLPKDEQFEATDQHDGKNLMGRFLLENIWPRACNPPDHEGGHLVNTQHKVNSINSQKLTWKAKFDPNIHFGKTKEQAFARYHGGALPESEQIKAEHTVTLSTAGFEPPKEFRTSDTHPGQTPCNAYKIMNQGSCGSCYAFAADTAFSARMCHVTDGKWNIVQSPQETIDCYSTPGCNGGIAYYIWEALANEKSTYAVEEFCDPYQSGGDGKTETCGGHCAKGNRYSGVAGSMVRIDMSTPDGRKQAQLEIMKNGPAYMSFETYDSWSSYSKGVYSQQAHETEPDGGHAMTLIGWGEEDGVPYWLMQNSYGADWGQEGLAKIRRGFNDFKMEERGIWVVKPELPSACPNAPCKNGATILNDCTCKCKGGFKGASCETCDLQCKNGGVRKDDCSGCFCPAGTGGLDCGDGFTVETLSACEKSGGGTTLKVSWSFPSLPPPKQGSWFNLHKEGQDGALHSKPLGAGFQPAQNPQDPIPSSGYVAFDIFGNYDAGNYYVELVEYRPPNEFGNGAGHMYSKTFPRFPRMTILPASSCSDSALASAAQKNDPANVLAQEVQVKQEAAVQKQNEMTARLDAAAAALEAVHDMNAAESHVVNQLTIDGVDTDHPILWQGSAPVKFCWSIKPSENKNPKFIFTYIGDKPGGSYYPTGLSGTIVPDQPLPKEDEGCLETNVSPGIPAGVYTFALEGGGMKYDSKTVYVAKAAVQWMQFGGGNEFLDCTIGWHVTPDAATSHDWVGIYDSEGTEVDWFYTSETESPVPQGSKTIRIWRDSAPGGGYRAFLHHHNTMTRIAEAQDWFPWTKYGF